MMAAIQLGKMQQCVCAIGELCFVRHRERYNTIELSENYFMVVLLSNYL